MICITRELTKIVYLLSKRRACHAPQHLTAASLELEPNVLALWCVITSALAPAHYGHPDESFPELSCAIRQSAINSPRVGCGSNRIRVEPVGGHFVYLTDKCASRTQSPFLII